MEILKLSCTRRRRWSKRQPGDRITRATSVFDATGKLTDDKIRDQLRDFVRGFSVFAATSR